MSDFQTHIQINLKIKMKKIIKIMSRGIRKGIKYNNKTPTITKFFPSFD